MSKDIELPHGKRLKRTVRTEHRKIPISDEEMRKYQLDMSEWECRRIYKSINRTLHPTEELDQLVSRIMLSDYYREGLTNVDERVRAAAEFLAKENPEPPPRPNPENKALKRRIAELKRENGPLVTEIASWKRAKDKIIEMEQNPVILPKG